MFTVFNKTLTTHVTQQRNVSDVFFFPQKDVNFGLQRDIKNSNTD